MFAWSVMPLSRAGVTDYIISQLKLVNKLGNLNSITIQM